MIMDGLIENEDVNDFLSHWARDSPADLDEADSFADMFGIVADTDASDTVADTDDIDLDACDSIALTVADSDTDGSLADPGYEEFPIALSGKRNAADDIVHYMKYVTRCSDTVTAMQAMNPKDKKNRTGSMAYGYIFLKVVKGIDMDNAAVAELAKKRCTDAARQLLRILYASYINEMIEAGWTISESWKPGGAKRQRVK